MTGLRSFWGAAAVIAAVYGSAGLVTAWAHHSFGLYDMTRSVEVDGTVVQMEWSNPHCWLFISTRGSGAPEVTYGFEMTSVGEMTRRGWKKSAVKPGDQIKVTYHPLRDGRNGGLMMSVMTADGRTIGRAPGGQPPTEAAPPPAGAN